MDSNGYNKSLLDTEAGECYLCPYVGDTARHEIFYGTSTRALSKRLGLWVNLCPRCHAEVHADKKDGEKSKTLIADAKAAFIKAGYTEQQFTDTFITGKTKWWEI